MRHLGQKIREERKELGFTLSHFAELLGTSNSMLQRVETGAKSPSVDLMIDICDICRKPLDYFLKETPTGFRKFEPVHRKRIHTDQSDVTILCPYGIISRDTVVSRFEGKAGARIPFRHQAGYCWVYIIRGECVFEHDGVSHPLKAGDAIYYDAEKPHCLKILTDLESIRITIKREKT